MFNTMISFSKNLNYDFKIFSLKFTVHFHKMHRVFRKECEENAKI